MTVVVAFAAWTAIGWLAFHWTAQPAPVRRWLPRLALILALASFALAPFLSGSLSQPMGPFIAGPNLYPAETVERPAGVAAVGVGLAFLALYALMRFGGRLSSRHPVANAAGLTLLVFFLRLWLEELALPLRLVTFFGIIWLIVPVAAYLGVAAARAGSLRRLWAWMLCYAFGIRGFVVFAMLVATRWRLGTHLDNSAVTRFSAFGREVAMEPGSWDQYRTLILVPQLILWSGMTLLAGLLVGWPCYAVARRRATGTPH